MNMQAMMQQAQKLQKEMLNMKKEKVEQVEGYFLIQLRNLSRRERKE